MLFNSIQFNSIQFIQVRQFAETIAEEHHAFGLGGIHEHLAVLQDLLGIHRHNMLCFSIFVGCKTGPDLGGSTFGCKVVGHHLGPGPAALAGGVAVEVDHGHEDVDVLPHLGGILAIVILAVWLGHKGCGEHYLGINGLGGLADLLAELGHATCGGDFLGRIVLVGGAAEADVIQMDAIYTVLHVLDGALDNLVEVFLLVAVERIIHGIDPLAVFVEGLEPDMHFHPLALGVVNKSEGHGG